MRPKACAGPLDLENLAARSEWGQVSTRVITSPCHLLLAWGGAPSPWELPAPHRCKGDAAQRKQKGKAKG